MVAEVVPGALTLRVPRTLAQRRAEASPQLDA